MFAVLYCRWGTFMQLMSITELARPRWMRKLDRSADGSKSVPSASEAISIVEKLVNGGFDSPSGGFDTSFDPPSFQTNDKGKPSNNFSPEDIYKTIRGLQQADEGRGGRSGGRLMADEDMEPHATNNPRHGRYVKGGNRGGDGYRDRYDRYGESPRDRESRRSRAAQRSGYRSRRFASGNQFASNFQRQLGTIMQRRRRDY